MLHTEEILISATVKLRAKQLFIKRVFFSFYKVHLITRKYEQKFITKRNITISLTLSF